MNYLLLTPVYILTGFALLVLLLDVLVPAKDHSYLGWFSIAGLLITLLTVIDQLVSGTHGLGWGGMFFLDPYALYFQILFLLSAILVGLTSIGYLARADHADRGEFFSLFLLAVLGAMLMVETRNLLPLYVALELLSLSSYALSGFLRDDPRSSEAALKYFLLGSLSSAVLLYGVSLLYGLSVVGTTDLAALAAHLPWHGPELGVSLVGILMVLGAFAFKISLFPFQFWAPDTYQGAPTPLAAFLSVASKAAGFAVLFRVFLVAFPHFHPDWQPVVVFLAVATMFLGNLVALTQESVKRMLAYSSIAQAGYILIGLAVGTHAALTASLFYLLAYVFMNIGAFSVVGHLAGTGQGDTLDDFAGLGRRHRALALAMTVFLLSLAGFPPTAGLVGKILLFTAAATHGFFWLAVVGFVNSLVSFYYYFRVIRAMYWDPRDPVDAIRPAGGTGVALTVAAVGVLTVGLWAQPFIDLARTAVTSLLH